jgi:large subunit ribosomal protein L10
LNRQEKEQMISDLHKQVEQARTAVLTHYRGLNVEQLSSLRQKLRDEKVSFHVVKNTLMKKASEGTDLEKLKDYFEGPTAMAVSHGDPVSLAKILSDFVKTQPTLEIKVGLIQGRVVTPAEMKAIATMPSREVLLAQILGGIQTPGGQLGGGILGAIQQVLGVIQARADQLEKQAGPST